MNTRQLIHFPHPTHTTVLDNGLRVITMQTQSNLARVMLAFRYGGMHCSIPGSAHMLEHLLYEGPARKGMHPMLVPLAPTGVEGNAITCPAYTGYSASGGVEYVRRLIDAIWTIGFVLMFTEEMVAREKGVIRGEILEWQLDNRFFAFQSRNKYPHCPGLHYPNTETRESLEQITYEGLLREHEEYYHAANAAIIVVGDVEHDSILESVSRREPPRGAPINQELLFPTFSDITYACPDRAPKVEYYFSSPQDEAEQTLLRLARRVIADHPFSILNRRLRLEKAMVYSIGTGEYWWPRLEVAIAVGAEPELFDAIGQEIERAIQTVSGGDIPQDTFDAVIGCELLDLATQKHEISGSEWEETLVGNWLDKTLTTDVDHKRIVQNATPGDLARVARQYLAKHGILRLIQE